MHAASLLEAPALSRLIVTARFLLSPPRQCDSLCSAMCVKFEKAKLIAKWWCYDRGTERFVQCSVCLRAREGLGRTET